jgi:hypothetical protein
MSTKTLGVEEIGKVIEVMIQNKTLRQNVEGPEQSTIEVWVMSFHLKGKNI